jgi:uncharacterized protein with ParB-like and HNH nuclease domain
MNDIPTPPQADDLSDSDEMEIETDENEEEALIEYDIASYPSDFTLDNLYSQWGKQSIIIPEFQREYVWTIEQASLLIDSFMLGLPVPPVFLYLDENSKYLVIDGQQRLLSVFFFFEGLFGKEEHGKRKVFKLTGLNEGVRYAGKTLKEFQDDDRRKLEASVLRAINIRQISPSEQDTSVYHIFERLNTGGTPLKPQEIRNCVFSGKFVTILKELNKEEYWRRIIGKQALDKHQKDVELVLRLFALIDESISKYEKPMKEFLNRAMKRYRDGTSPNVQKFQEGFRSTCKIIIERLNDRPFHVRGPINAAYLDSIFCVIYNNLNRLPESLSGNYEKLKQDKDFNNKYTKGGTQDTNILKDRYQCAESILMAH